MLDNSFKPAEITVSAGTTVTFDLPNIGQVPHNMHIASARGIYRETDWLSKPESINPRPPAAVRDLVWAGGVTKKKQKKKEDKKSKKINHSTTQTPIEHTHRRP